MTLEPLRVDVVLIDVWASIKLVVAIERDGAVAGDGEAECWATWRVEITLELVSVDCQISLMIVRCVRI